MDYLLWPFLFFCLWRLGLLWYRYRLRWVVWLPRYGGKAERFTSPCDWYTAMKVAKANGGSVYRINGRIER